MYERYAAHKTVFIAAFTQEGGVIGSNIPFMVAADGPRVGFEYESSEGLASPSSVGTEISTTSRTR